MSAGTSGTKAAPTVCITVDMEPDCPPYLWTWRGITEGAPRLLELFAAEGVPATCFTTGQVAERFPEVVAGLVDSGHELACHGVTHTAFPDLDEAQAKWEIESSAETLRRFAPVTSFRAPYLRFPDAYLRLLEQAGFLLDSSQAKYKRSYYGRAAATSLARIPASMTSSVLRLPPAIRDPWLLALSDPVVLFVHPWEFVDLTRERLRLDCRFRTGLPALGDLRDVIRLFAARGARFVTMETLRQERVGNPRRSAA